MVGGDSNLKVIVQRTVTTYVHVFKYYCDCEFCGELCKKKLYYVIYEQPLRARRCDLLLLFCFSDSTPSSVQPRHSSVNVVVDVDDVDI